MVLRARRIEAKVEDGFTQRRHVRNVEPKRQWSAVKQQTLIPWFEDSRCVVAALREAILDFPV
jgi:hypothetical protein